jgi:hypothetical protein
MTTQLVPKLPYVSINSSCRAEGVIYLVVVFTSERGG